MLGKIVFSTVVTQEDLNTWVDTSLLDATEFVAVFAGTGTEVLEGEDDHVFVLE